MSLMIVHRPEAISALGILSDPLFLLVHILLLRWHELPGLDLDDAEEALEPLSVPELVHLLLHQVDDTLVFDGIA
jgi:hypothetical protein